MTDRYLGTSPCREIPLPRMKPEPMRFLSPDEVARLADCIDPRYRALVLVAAYGGLRIGELAALTVERVDLDRRQVQVVETVSWVKGHLHLHEPKTASGRRRVGLPRFVADELAEHIERYATDLVFPSPGGGYLQPSQFRTRQFAPAARKAGLEGLRVHDLRHTAVSPLDRVRSEPQGRGGPGGPRLGGVTLDRYGHLMDDHDAELMDALDAVGHSAKADGNVVSLAARSK